ncbi:MAG: O-phosphoserine--tRNA ligase [Candidatus Firestonebacteria bacterium]|nr:O-phosphoserine--tRNA ligase [Candidatus Firestonebacteria bacterium]
MSNFNITEIKNKSKEDFEKTWKETAKLVLHSGRFMEWKEEKGKEHPLNEVCEKFRKTFLQYGLTEIVSPAIIEEGDVYRQYGPEAAVILDRLFFLAGIPRADIGVGKREKEQILSIDPEFNKFEELQKIFREYKKGELEADNLIEIMVNRLLIDEITASTILDKVFTELKQLKPIASKLTLRSHMTACWFGVISDLIKKEELPLKLFSIGSRFRREQRLDSSHLYESTSASVVIVSEKMSVEDGYDFTQKILNKMGFNQVKFEPKKVTSKYYAVGTEYEVYASFKGKYLEIANIGFYSPVSLSNYDIPYNVFNLGFGVERMAMILNNVDDIRNLIYGYAYEKLTFTDQGIVDLIGYEKKPENDKSDEIVNTIYKAAYQNKDKIGPVEIKAYEGLFKGQKLEITLYNWDKEKPLLSRASFNDIYVYNRSIYGLPESPDNLSPELKKVFDSGIKVNMNYMKCVLYALLKDIETKMESFNIEYKMIKRPAEINIKIPDTVNRFIKNNKSRIEVKGPLFFGFRVKIE